MMQNIIVLLYILVFSIFAAIMWRKINKKKMDIAETARIIFFFFCCNYLILTLVKWYLGSGQDTLLESFWDCTWITYLHYGIPLLIFNVLAPLVFSKLKNEIGHKLILNFDMYMFLSVLAMVYTVRILDNFAYFLAFSIAGVLSIATLFVYKVEYTYYTGKSKTTIKSTVLAWGTYCVINGIYLPAELYLSNIGEFTGSYSGFFLIMLLGSLALMTIATEMQITILPQAVCDKFNIFLMGLAFMGYIQNIFLNGKLAALNGTEQQWSVMTKAFNLLIWGIVLIFLLVIENKVSMVVKVCRGVCMYIILVLLASVCWLSLTTDKTSQSSSGAMTTKDSLVVGTDDNVLVFVLDRLESLWMQELIDTEQDFVAPLSDFTFYRNATSQFADTRTSIPYMLTGTPWIEGMGAEYADYAYNNSTFLEEISQQGYNIGLYTNASHVAAEKYALTTNYAEKIARRYNIIDTFLTMWRSSMYKTTPFLIKNSFTYYSSDIAAMVQEKNVWSIENDIPFYESLNKQGLSVSEDYNKVFRFYHMRGAHEPYYLSEDLKYNSSGRDVGVFTQIKGSLNIVYEYLEQLKALGKYDNATIIITADHGQQVDFDEENGKPTKTLMPVLLVKRPNEHHKQMVYNEAPVSHKEYVATLAESMGADIFKYGTTLENVSINEVKERTCVSLWYGHIIKYTINGDARNIDNWKAMEVQPLQ